MFYSINKMINYLINSLKLSLEIKEQTGLFTFA